MKRVAAIASIYDAEIEVLHIADDSEELLEEVFSWYETLVRQELEYPKLSFKLLKASPLQETLRAYVKDCSTDILAMYRRQRGLLGRLFSTSNRKEMAYDCQCPLLIFHAENLIAPDEVVKQVRTMGLAF